MTKVLLKVDTGEGYLWRFVDEDEAVKVMNDYKSVGWTCYVVSEAVETESGTLLV